MKLLFVLSIFTFLSVSNAEGNETKTITCYKATNDCPKMFVIVDKETNEKTILFSANDLVTIPQEYKMDVQECFKKKKPHKNNVTKQ